MASFEGVGCAIAGARFEGSCCGFAVVVGGQEASGRWNVECSSAGASVASKEAA